MNWGLSFSNCILEILDHLCIVKVVHHPLAACTRDRIHVTRTFFDPLFKAIHIRIVARLVHILCFTMFWPVVQVLHSFRILGYCDSIFPCDYLVSCGFLSFLYKLCNLFGVEDNAVEVGDTPTRKLQPLHQNVAIIVTSLSTAKVQLFLGQLL